MSKEPYVRLAAIQENPNAPKNQRNLFDKYKYRNCKDILEGAKPSLNGLLLSISDEVVLIGDRYYVKATIATTDGENSHTTTAPAREEESKKGMDSAQATGATSSHAHKYCLSGLLGIDDAKDADTDGHKHQQNTAAEQSEPSPIPEQVLKAFTDAAMQKNTVEEPKQVFAKAWKILEGIPEQRKAQNVYNIRRDELEGAAA